MTVGLSGIGLGVLYLAFLILFSIILIITSILLLLQKSKTQSEFRKLKTTPFFLANIFTALFIFSIALLLNLLKIRGLFLDHAPLSLLITILLTTYSLPFIVLTFLFKKAR